MQLCLSSTIVNLLIFHLVFCHPDEIQTVCFEQLSLLKNAFKNCLKLMQRLQ